MYYHQNKDNNRLAKTQRHQPRIAERKLFLELLLTLLTRYAMGKRRKEEKRKSGRVRELD